MKVTIASFTPFLHNIDDEILKKYFMNKNIDVDIISWNDETYNWTKSDIVLLRSTWNSYNMLSDYKKWLEYIEKNNIKMFNDISIINNNIFKERQINWIKKNNIPIMDCEVFSKTNFEYMNHPESTLMDTIKKYFKNKKVMFVLKPTVSAMGNDTYIIDPYHINDDDNFKIFDNYEELFETLLEKYKDRGIIIQEFSKEIKNGEFGLVFLDGNFVIGSKKIYGEIYGKNLKELNNPDKKMIDFAKKIVDKLPKDKVAYARIDVINTNEGYKVMELELADADLYIRKIDGFPFWIENEKESIKESYIKGAQSEILIKFIDNMLERNKYEENKN